MNPKTRTIVAIVVIVIVVVAGVGLYFYITRPTSCALRSSNPIVLDQPEAPDSMDPAVTFTTPGWAAVEQVYQSLVMYNGSSYTSFVGMLAKNWSTSSDGFHWNFTLWPGIHFSNGDPINAYVVWYSLYRSLVVNQGPAFILAENFGLPDTAANVSTELNSWNFFTPTASQIATMSAPNQSFVALSNLTIQFNLGSGYLGAVPYHYLLPTLVAPVASAVDPAVVSANGGVQPNTKNSFLGVNMLGSGQYKLASTYNPSGTSFTLVPDPNYWGRGVAAQEPWNSMIQPANRTIQTDLQGDSSLVVQDLKTGSVGVGSFTYIGPSTLSELSGVSCVVAQPLPTVYGATAGSWWIYMNQSQAPFNNLTVRDAVVHAIDYPTIISRAFGGDASQWVGPVPPSYPYYNPANLTPYQYDLPLAKSLMAQSPWPHGYPSTLNYEYLNFGGWTDVATILKQDLAAIGININPIGISLNTLIQDQSVGSDGQCIAQDTAQGGPFPIGQEFYTSDYISPDDWTQNDAISYGSANMCMSGYANSTMDNLVIAAAGESRSTNLTSDYTQMTQLMYENYTDAWLVVPTSFAVYNNGVHGIISNPMGSALPYVMMYNTEWAT
ncbi:MAG TPA: ABC transporter substrate-binding protein [Thermoplasmata archaeon]|nr:ABC transporter substrate-binding protein [Thermoplasmata archaeon]